MSATRHLRSALPTTPFVRSKTFPIEIPCFPVLKYEVQRAGSILVWELAEAAPPALYLTAYGASMKKMDYTIRFEAGRAGQKWTATALTDRAKERTPEPVTFAGRPEALTFLKDSKGEGYRFSGAELVDPVQRLVKNRYFVIGSDGQLALAGEDNGPRDTVWDVGDVMPGRGMDTETEAVIEKHSSRAGGARAVWLRPRVRPSSTLRSARASRCFVDTTIRPGEALSMRSSREVIR